MSVKKTYEEINEEINEKIKNGSIGWNNFSTSMKGDPLCI